MKPLKPLLLAIPLFCAASFVTSCDDDDDYTSEIPEFSDVTFHVIEADDENLRVGDKIVATAVQSKKGRLLYGADMSWTTNPETSHSYKEGVVYDAQNENPTDTIVATTSGWHTLTFTAKYDVSGIAKTYNSTVDFADGSGSVSYQTLSLLYYQVTIRKRFYVMPAEDTDE